MFLRVRADLRCANGRLDLADADYRTALELAVDPRWRFADYEDHIHRGLWLEAGARGKGLVEDLRQASTS